MAYIRPLCLLALCVATADARDWVRYERTQRLMGTQFTITLFAEDRHQADAAFDAAFQRIRQLDQTLSNYKPDSEINRLCASAPHDEPIGVSRDTWRVLKHAQQVSHMSSGAFDVTLGPVTRLWRRARQRRELPDATRLASARASTGFQRMKLDDETQSVQLQRSGMKLDLGGIAKGDALDQAMLELQKAGVTAALINGGGDVLAGEAPPGKTAWQIGLVGLKDDRLAGALPLCNRAAATSGDLWQYFEIGGTRYSHIVDPRTGYGLTERSTVTVTAPRAIDADALASTISVMGPTEGLRFANRHEGFDARIVYEREGRPTVVTSDGFPAAEAPE